MTTLDWGLVFVIVVVSIPVIALAGLVGKAERR